MARRARGSTLGGPLILPRLRPAMEQQQRSRSGATNSRARYRIARAKRASPSRLMTRSLRTTSGRLARRHRRFRYMRKDGYARVLGDDVPLNCMGSGTGGVGEFGCSRRSLGGLQNAGPASVTLSDSRLQRPNCSPLITPAAQPVFVQASR